MVPSKDQKVLFPVPGLLIADSLWTACLFYQKDENCQILNSI